MDKSVGKKLPDPAMPDTLRREGRSTNDPLRLIFSKGQQQKQNNKDCCVDQDHIAHGSREPGKSHRS